MKSIRKYLPIALGIVALFLILGLVGTQDLKDEEKAASYTAEIMESAKQEALNRQRTAQWHNLNKQANDMLALGEMK